MKKKIYITSLHMMHGGIEMAITLLANSLVKRGYDVEILCTYNLGEPVYELNKDVKLSYLTSVRPNRTEFKEAIKNRKLVSVIREGLYALKVLYLKKHTMKKCIKLIETGTVIATRNEHAVLLSKWGKDSVKKIAQLHHDHCFDEKLMSDFKTKYERIDIFVLLTEWLEQEIKEMMIDNHHTKHVVIPNYVLREEKTYNVKKENQVIAVGRLHEVKGFLRMLEIWKETQIDESYCLKIIGSGEQYEEIQKRIKELNLSDKVVLTGALSHEKVLEEMRRSKAYLMTSFSEAFPFVLIEAMAAGLPIVAFDVRVGPRAMVENEQNGYLIKDGNGKEFSIKLSKLLSDETMLKDMSQKAEKRVEDFFEEKVIEKWIQIL